MKDTIVQHNQAQEKCYQTGMFPATEEVFDVYPVSGFNDAVHSKATRSSSGLGIRSVVKKDNFKGFVPEIEQTSETEYASMGNSVLKKLDAFSTWAICKLLPKSLTSCPPPDRQIYY